MLLKLAVLSKFKPVGLRKIFRGSIKARFKSNDTYAFENAMLSDTGLPFSFQRWAVGFYFFPHWAQPILIIPSIRFSINCF